MEKNNIAIYPGSFDPITNGHLDLIERSSKLFDRLIVAVSNKSVSKKYLFSVNERIDLINDNIVKYKNVEVKIFDELLVNFANRNDANIIIRGLRALSDFESEFQMSLMNRKLSSNIETIFLMPHEKYTYTSSSLIKEVLSLGGPVNDYVPSSVVKALKEKYE